MSTVGVTRNAQKDPVGKVATLWAGPGEASNSTSSVDENVAYRFVLDNKVQTISSNSIPESGMVQGLLFVPRLDSQDPCYNTTASYVPSNVTRYEDVSDFGYSLIGLAPWVSAECSLSFLSAGQKVGTHAMIFFQPSSNETGLPPDSNDSRWSTNDGEKWRMENDYPVYAIPGPAGTSLIRDLSTFPRDSTHGKRDNSTHAYESQSKNDRLFARVETGQESGKMPSLWSFVLAIAGTVLVLSLVLVIVYRLFLRKRRDDFQRRMVEGQVDIEALALNQMKAPKEVVDKMPLYTYLEINPSPEPSINNGHTPENETEHDLVDKTTLVSPKEDNQSLDDVGLKKPEAAVIQSGKQEKDEDKRAKYRLSHTQTTCAICLDDFVAGSSMVRELPCGHIFDSECIDPCLTNNSCLCPLCKKSVLPACSYYIPMTNEMAQRENISRQSE